MTMPSEQTLILLIGIALLASPAVISAITLWVKSLIQKSREDAPPKPCPPKEIPDAQIATIVRVLEMKKRLEQEGHQQASGIVRDLVYSVVYGEVPPKSDTKGPTK